MKPTVAITIANWNGMAFLEPCLQSLAAQTHNAHTVYIVDNGSTDGSVEYIQENYPEWTLITLDYNSGFAPAHTMAIQQALHDHPTLEYVLTFNNDAMMSENFIDELVACAKRHPDAGSIQGKVVNAAKKKEIDATGILTYFDTSAINRGRLEKDTGQYDTEEEIFGPSASAALYSVAALEDTTLPNGDFFDSSYFAYYEDVDLAWRLRLAGYTAWYTPDAVVSHIHSATGVSHSPFKAYHIHRNHYFNIIKLLPFPQLLKALLFLPIRYPLLVSSVIRGKGASAKFKQKKDVGDTEVASTKTLAQRPDGSTVVLPSGMVAITIRALLDVIHALPQLLRVRRVIQKNKVVDWKKVGKWTRLYKAPLSIIIYGHETHSDN